MVSQLVFFFFQSAVPINVRNEAWVIYGVKGYVNVADDSSLHQAIKLN
jgi:hypothetical protein